MKKLMIINSGQYKECVVEDLSEEIENIVMVLEMKAGFVVWASIY